jgi:hypothetical protein
MSKVGPWLLVLALLCAGCPAPQSDPPPPPRKPEIPTAPPRALGALAGGTDAAPKPEAALPNGELAPGLPLPSPIGPKGGGAPSPAPQPEGSESPPGAAPVPGTPDAGMAL